MGLCQPSQLQDYVHCRITFYLIPYSTDLEVSICGFVMASLADLIVFCDPALKPGRVIRVTFSPGHPGLTRIGSREKRNCSFDDVETSKRYRVALS